MVFVFSSLSVPVRQVCSVRLDKAYKNKSIDDVIVCFCFMSLLVQHNETEGGDSNDNVHAHSRRRSRTTVKNKEKSYLAFGGTVDPASRTKGIFPPEIGCSAACVVT